MPDTTYPTTSNLDTPAALNASIPGTTFGTSDLARTATTQNKLDLNAELEKIKQQALALKTTIDLQASKANYQKTTSDLTLLDPNTGRTQVIYNPDINSSQIQSLVNQGWTVQTGSLPATVTKPTATTGAATTSTANPYDQLINDSQAKVNALSQKITNQEYDPLTQSVLQQITDSYNRAIQQQKQLNYASEQATTTRGFRLGTAQYSPGLAAQELTATVNDGLKAVADLQGKMQEALIKAKQADMDKKYEVLDKEMTNLKTLQKDKADKIAETNVKVQEALAKHEEEVKKAQDQAMLQNKALIEIQNGNTDTADIFKKVNYNKNGTLIDNPLLPKDIQALIDSKTGNKAGTQRILTDAEAKKYGLPKGSSITIAEAQSLGLMPKVSSGTENLTQGQIQTAVSQIVSQFDNEQVVKNFNVVNEGYQFAKTLAGKKETTSADDIGLIYAFAKAMDPNSVVREGEYATVQKYAQSWAQAFGFKVERIFSNTPFLTQSARDNMVATIEAKQKVSKQNYDNIYTSYQRKIEEAKSGKIAGSLVNYAAAYPEQSSRVKVKSPQGKIGTIPWEQLPDAIKQGYFQVQ